MRSTAATEADSSFRRAISVAEALTATAAEARGQQWAHRDFAVNRSVVVLTVAAWQGWVKTYVTVTLEQAARDLATSTIDSEAVRRVAQPLCELGLRQVRRFNTPDAPSVRALLALIGEDPSSRWTFTATGGRRDATDVPGRLDDWLQVRHAIAHGQPHLPDVDVLGRTAAGHGSLTHRHASWCIEFFRDLVEATGA